MENPEASHLTSRITESEKNMQERVELILYARNKEEEYLMTTILE